MRVGSVLGVQLAAFDTSASEGTSRSVAPVASMIGPMPAAVAVDGSRPAA